MKTVTVQIGNSDDKLTQIEWARFITNIRMCLQRNATAIHFSGGSAFDMSWQNACFVFLIQDNYLDDLRERLAYIRQEFRQDSLAFTVGETEML